MNQMIFLKIRLMILIEILSKKKKISYTKVSVLKMELWFIFQNSIAFMELTTI